MTNNILLYSVILLSLLFILIMILLLMFPDIKDYLIFLSSVILIIISVLSYKCINKEKCSCGKGENINHNCPICGAVEYNTIKEKKDIIINLINAIKDNNQNNAFRALQSIGINNCNQQQDASEFLGYMVGDLLMGNKQNDDIIIYMPPKYIRMSGDKEENKNLIGSAKYAVVAIDENLIDEYDLIGLINHSGGTTSTSSSGHYTAFVKYNSGWYYCNDTQIQYLNEYDDIFNNINNNNNIRILLYVKKNNLVNGSPPPLTNFGVTCYSNAALQIILASGILEKSQNKINEGQLIENQKMMKIQLEQAQKKQEKKIFRKLLIKIYQDLLK